MQVYGTLDKAQLEGLGADPTPASVGRIWYRTDTNLIKADTGAAIQLVLSSLTPATIKGDTYVFGTALAKLGIGTDGQVYTADAASAAGLKWADPVAAPNQSDEISNVSLAVSVAASAMTIALKQKDGSTDPSTGTAACKFGFRDVTSATGDFTQATVTGALSVVIPSTVTIGTVSAKAEYIYVYALNNAGTVELAVSLTKFDQGSVVTTTAIASGASRTTMYSTTARTSKPIRLIGRILCTQATAGTWASGATEISLIPFGDITTTQTSQVLCDTGNGFGATSTKVRRFTNSATIGADITYADDSNLGGVFTINTAGIYFIYFSDLYTSGSTVVGITLNSAALTTNPQGQSAAVRLAINESPANDNSSCSIMARLKPGDVIRPMGDPGTGSTGDNVQFRIMRIAD